MFYVQLGSHPGWSLSFNLLIFVAGAALLAQGSDWLVDAAAALARRWKAPELVIGLTLVSIGTSLPELASSVCASIEGRGQFIIGNIVGSNVANIALILALGAVGAGTLPFRRQALSRDLGVMLGTYALICLLFGLTVVRTESSGVRIHGLNAGSGVLLLLLCAAYLALLFREREKEPAPGGGGPEARRQPLRREAALLLAGIGMIALGAKAMVDPVVWGAETLHVSELAVASTIVAFGTSVPELAVTIAGVAKKRHDIAFGNIIGSNIFNILLIFGVTACIGPLPLNTGGAGVVNLIMMAATGAALWLLMRLGKTALSRRHGVILLALYLLFVIYNCRTALGRQ